MACDMRIASEYAVFGQPEVGLGITPIFGDAASDRYRRKGKGCGNNSVRSKYRCRDGGKTGTGQPYGSRGQIDGGSGGSGGESPNAPLAVKWAEFGYQEGLETNIDTGISHRGGSVRYVLCHAGSEGRNRKLSWSIEKPEFKGR